MIIRKELHSQFDNSIHNEIQNINSFLKDENKNQNEEKKKNNNINTNNNKINFDDNKEFSFSFSNDTIIKNRNVYEKKENNTIEDNKNIKKYFINKLCKEKIEIIENIEKYTINEQKLFFPNIADLFCEEKLRQTFSQYSESKFINYLQESQKLHNIPLKLNVKNSLNLYLKGDKSNLLCDKNIYLISNSFKKDLDKINNLLKKNDILENFITEVIEELNTNLKNIYDIMSETFEYLEEYKDINNIKNILRTADIKIPFNPMKILFSKNKNIDIEQRYIIKKVCACLIIKNYFEELKTIKNKIKNLNIIKFDKEIKLKIKIIEYFQLKIDEESKIKKSYFEDIWNSLKERNIFVDGTSEKMI